MQMEQVGEILGGEKNLGRKIENKMDLVELGKAGISKKCIANLADYLSLSWKEVADLLPITERTLQRYAPHQHFNTGVSEQVLHIAKVIAKGNEVFHDKKKLILWLNAPHRGLSGNTPFAMLASRFGADLVLEELGRIEWGVYS